MFQNSHLKISPKQNTLIPSSKETLENVAVPWGRG